MFWKYATTPALLVKKMLFCFFSILAVSMLLEVTLLQLKQVVEASQSPSGQQLPPHQQQPAQTPQNIHFNEGLQPQGAPYGTNSFLSQHTRTYLSPQRGNEKTAFECMNAVFPGSNCVHPPYHIVQQPHPKENAEQACKLLSKRVANVTHTSLYALLNQLLEVNCSDAGAFANQICGLQHDSGVNLVVYGNGSWGFKEASPSIRYMVICE